MVGSTEEIVAEKARLRQVSNYKYLMTLSSDVHKNGFLLLLWQLYKVYLCMYLYFSSLDEFVNNFDTFALDLF